MNTQWHGRENEYEIGTGGVPSQPSDLPSADVPPDSLERDQGARGDVGPFAVVRFVGRWGIGCLNAREFERARLSYGDAREIAWDAFGLCGGNVSFYDNEGNLVMERRAPLP